MGRITELLLMVILLYIVKDESFLAAYKYRYWKNPEQFTFKTQVTITASTTEAGSSDDSSQTTGNSSGEKL